MVNALRAQNTTDLDVTVLPSLTVSVASPDSVPLDSRVPLLGHAALLGAMSALAWQRWRMEIRFPRAGYYEVWARATDSRGRAQPMITPGWNPEGDVNNQCHRIAVTVM